MALKILQKTCRKHNAANAEKIIQTVAAYFFYEKKRRFFYYHRMVHNDNEKSVKKLLTKIIIIQNKPYIQSSHKKYSQKIHCNITNGNILPQKAPQIIMVTS